MSLCFKGMTGFLVLVAALTSVTKSAIAQPNPNSEGGSATVAEAFNQTYFATDPTFFRNRSIGRQLDMMLGIGSLKDAFIEQEITRDAELLHSLYKEALSQQVSGEVATSSRDLPNPYASSIQSERAYNANNLDVAENTLSRNR